VGLPRHCGQRCIRIIGASSRADKEMGASGRRSQKEPCFRRRTERTNSNWIRRETTVVDAWIWILVALVVIYFLFIRSQPA